jgi:hypothetical protein
MVSVKHKVEFLLDQQYKVLIYNGQADVILGAPLCEHFLQKMKWSGMDYFSHHDSHLKVRMNTRNPRNSFGRLPRLMRWYA